MTKTLSKIIPAIAIISIAGAAVADTDDRLVNPVSRTGSRTMLLLGTLYDLTLEIDADLSNASAKTLIETNAVMSLTIEIKSGMVSRERFVKTTTEGFEKAAKSGYKSDKTADFLKQFDGVDFKKGAIVIMKATEDTLETRFKESADGEGKILGIIDEAADLKKALFAIWLGDNPAQDSLKEQLLGKKK